ncbi:S8 family serine peptidase [Anaerosalibacter massiliensis]|uniref:S8 family serine peptidase n=1 Tax=Anaerosalibacter massiliensis TaxID=1347392 RepID=A0A9X2MGB1_9FIRM|nr:S8 family serine peptidase [Anaerosalibacter massiliensis]MCR2043149.1 S8 family serine peptidase [Anaerosalibacter massiliensis]
MGKIKVAIVDSGIDLDNTYLTKYIIKGKSFILDESNRKIIEGNDIRDSYGHGTSCAYTILRQNESVEIFPIKILNSLGRTSSKCLLEGLKFLIDTDIKLINISLATVNFDREKEFIDICKELIDRNKIIVASMDNMFRESLPAILPGVIGVRGKNLGFTNEYWYDKNKKIQCICDNEPIFVPKINEKGMKLFGHNSKATSLMTAKISKLLDLNKELKYREVEELLLKYSSKTSWTSEELKEDKLPREIVEKRELEGEMKEKANELCKLIIETYDSKIEDIDFLYQYSLFNNFTKMNKHNCFDIIDKIENKFNIKIKYDEISMSSFYSIYSLLDIVIKYS